MKKNIIATILMCALIATVSSAQSPKEKSEAMAAEFNKGKHKIKEKNGVITKKNKVVEAKPEVREDLASHAGKYEMDGFGHSIVLRQSGNGWEGDYFVKTDDKDVKKGSLKDIKIEAGLFNATIHHDDGRVLPFEGVFINRSANGVSSSGLGIKHLMELSNGFSVDKAFYKRAE